MTRRDPKLDAQVAAERAGRFLEKRYAVFTGQ